MGAPGPGLEPGSLGLVGQLLPTTACVKLVRTTSTPYVVRGSGVSGNGQPCVAETVHAFRARGLVPCPLMADGRKDCADGFDALLRPQTGETLPHGRASRSYARVR